MQTLSRALLLTTMFFFQLPLFAQAGGGDFMRSLGKMYVVVGVIVLVFLGLVAFVWFLDRRLTKLEDQIDQHAKR
ncbi:MAG: CcmD family protein [Bacteroidota bacterium]